MNLGRTLLIDHSYNGFAAAILGMFVGGTMDLLLTFISNALWKLREEKKSRSICSTV